MENASKALLIAGGILIAIIILSLVVYVASTMGNVADAEDKRIATKQLEDFNKSYLAYNKTRMYGTDVLTVFNKAEEDRQEYGIEIIVKDKNGNILRIENNHDFKVSVFKCEEVHYNNKTGRISKMVFKKIEIKT